MTASYREQIVAAKEARVGVKDQRPVGSRSKRERPFVIEYRMKPRTDGLKHLFPRSMMWRKWGAYRTLDEASAALDTLQRKNSFNEYRHQPNTP